MLDLLSKEKKMKTLFQIVVAIVVISALAWYTQYIWSDCLEENSWFTCARMLNK